MNDKNPIFQSATRVVLVFLISTLCLLVLLSGFGITFNEQITSVFQNILLMVCSFFFGKSTAEQQMRNDKETSVADKPSVPEVIPSVPKSVPTPVLVAPALGLLGTTYSQNDGRWKYTKLPNAISPKDTIGRVGCLLACVSAYIGKTPLQITKDDPECFQSDGNLFTDKLLAKYGLKQTKKDVGLSAENVPVIARTTFYADKGIPTHYFHWLPDGSMLDTLVPNSVAEPCKYLGKVDQIRIIEKV